ncbi:MAG: hypothetical protein ACK4ZN_01480 [Oceanibaculum sp.]
MASVDEKQIKAWLNELANSAFDEIKVVAINVRPSVGADGDRIFEVSLVYAGKAQRLNPEKTLGLTRKLLQRLAKAGETGFPIISFIAQSDLGKTKPEAA